MTNADFNKQATQPGIRFQGKGEAVPSAPVPEKIGPYKIECLLERGGMSLLYLGTHPETQEPTTVKVLSPKFLEHPEIVKRFINEAEIIAMSNHQNIVQLYGYGQWEGGFYIAMEFIQGVSLRQYILQTPLSLIRALDIIIDIAYALCHLHSHGVIHRDLKPENILINESGIVKVIDFGIAQLLREQESEKGGAGSKQLIGTPIYMSPEQREHPDQVSYPSDLYSLGIIAYELVLGKLSHGQIHLSLMPRGMQKILHKALQPHPKDRYQDVVDLIADLSVYRTSEAIQKEKKPSDPVSEMVEGLKLAQMALVVGAAPQWPETEIGLAGHQGIRLSGIYYDFFEIPEGSYGIIMGEASSKEADGVIYTAVLRGMVRSLCRLTTKPVELVTILNDILMRDSMQQAFKLSYLILSPEKNQLSYISCGYNDLWIIENGTKKAIKVSAENKSLGISSETSFTDISHSWNVGDTVVLNSFNVSGSSSIQDLPDNFFEEALVENFGITPQKLVERILNKARIATKSMDSRSVSLISIVRKK